jgi:2-aminoadipate transaminase
MIELQTTQANIPADVIDLGIGQPELSLLPLDKLRQAAAHRLAQPDPAILQYGAEPGDAYFRLALAEFLTDGYGIKVAAETLFVTAGASQGLDLICSLFTQPGDTIFVEEPSYFLALQLFADHHLKLISIPVDEQGLVVEAVEESLRAHRPVFIYTIPTFQNPTGTTLSQSRRQALVELSRSHGFLIVADEVYHLLNYDIVPPAPLASSLDGGTIISLGSFSKILAPGLRLGWIQAAPALLERLVMCGLVQSGGGLNPFTSGVVRSILELGLQRAHLEWLKATYKRRAAALSQALQRELRPDVSFTVPEGGFFIWLKLPSSVDATQMLSSAGRHKVGFQPGAKFSSSQGLHNRIRLSFAYYDEQHLRQGATRLKQLFLDAW